MGEEPWPASLELMDRATPVRMMVMTPAPAKPPTADIGWKACCTIRPSAAGISLMC